MLSHLTDLYAKSQPFKSWYESCIIKTVYT